jgi:hypothetical protein
MKMLFALIGLVVLTAGVAALIHPRVSTPSKKKEVEISNHTVIYESVRYYTVPPVLSGTAVIAGALLIILGLRK